MHRHQLQRIGPGLAAPVAGRAQAAPFRRTGAGHLVVIGSLLGEIATPYMSSYVLSKWAVHGLVRRSEVLVLPHRVQRAPAPDRRAARTELRHKYVGR